jgi:hypothetical protein
VGETGRRCQAAEIASPLAQILDQSEPVRHISHEGPDFPEDGEWLERLEWLLSRAVS